MSNGKLLSLIASQLAYLNYESVAQLLVTLVGDRGIEIAIEPSAELEELVELGLKTQQLEAFGNEDEPMEGITGIEWDSKQPPLPAPQYESHWSTSHKSVILSAAFSPDGSLMASASQDANVKVFSVPKMRESGGTDRGLLKTLHDHAGPINELAFHPNGHVLVSGSDDGSVKFYDLLKTYAKRSFRFIQDAAPVNTLSFHPSGDFLLVGTQHPTYRLFDVHTLKCFTSPDSADLHSGPLTCVRYSPIGNMFATASVDGMVKIYDTHNSKLVRSLTISSPVYSANFSRNGRYLLTGSKDSIGRLWDISSGKVLMEYSGASQSTASVCMSFTYNEDFIIGSDENSYGIVLWDTRNGTFLKKILGHSGRIRNFASSPVNDGFVSCSEDAKVKYWDILN